jgi:hypothetical protein
MVKLDGKPLVDEATARLDLATEFGILYANFRNTTLENEALVKVLQATNDELAQTKQSLTGLSEKYRALELDREALAKLQRTRKKAI